MSEKNQGLGARDYDDVDAFGLDEFGAPAGLNPMWGAAIGSGLGTVAAIGLRQTDPTGFMARHAEALGFGAAAVASGAMIFFPGSRAAGWTGLAAAFLNNGLRALEQYVLKGGLSGVVIEPTTAFAGRGGLGMVDIERTTAFRGGATGLGRGSELPQLVGATLQSASDHVQLVGGPALNRFAGHWGATHWNH